MILFNLKKIKINVCGSSKKKKIKKNKRLKKLKNREGEGKNTTKLDAAFKRSCP
jgi:hypothetical protein